MNMQGIKIPEVILICRVTGSLMFRVVKRETINGGQPVEGNQFYLEEFCYGHWNTVSTHATLDQAGSAYEKLARHYEAIWKPREPLFETSFGSRSFKTDAPAHWINPLKTTGDDLADALRKAVA